MTDLDLFELARRTGEALKSRQLMLVTAESCTGGGVGAAITMVPGSSDWYERGERAYAVKEVMISGNFFDIAKNVVAVENTAGVLFGTAKVPAIAVDGVTVSAESD